MDSHTLLTVGFVVLVAAAAFVTARIGAIAIGVLPSAPGVDEGGHDVDDTAPVAEADDSEPDDGEGAARSEESRITADDLDRIRAHLRKDRFHRRPDDLCPSDDERS